MKNKLDSLFLTRLFASEPQSSPYRRGKIAFANFSSRVVAKKRSDVEEQYEYKRCNQEILSGIGNV